MTGFEWAMLISAIIGTGSALTSGQDVDTEAPAPPGGDLPDFDKISGDLAAPALTSIADIPTLAGPAAAAGAAAKTTPQTKVTTPPQIPTPDKAAITQAATPPPPNIPAPQLPSKPGPGIGQVLAEIPGALEAIAPLLGLTDQQIPTQTAAPISGRGGVGQLVGQFARQGAGIDIGQLLAALPGIRG